MHDVRNYELRIKNYDISVRELQQMIYEDDFDLVPSFKEGLKWNLREKSKYVESALLQLPLKNFLFEEDHVGRFIIVDGADRITALLDYIDNKFDLKSIPVLTELEGKYFHDLPYSEQMRLKRAVLSCDIISRDSNLLLKCEYLKRINLGNVNFLPQQARNFAFPKAYSLISEGRYNLDYYFNFRIVEKSYGSRRHISQIRTEQFYLCMMLIQKIYHDKESIMDSVHLGSALDQLCCDIEYDKSNVDVPFLFDNIQKVIDYLGFDNLNLVYRSYSLPRSYNRDELSMNDFLCRFFEASHGIEFNSVRFDFYREDVKLLKLVSYL